MLGSEDVHMKKARSLPHLLEADRFIIVLICLGLLEKTSDLKQQKLWWLCRVIVPDQGAKNVWFPGRLVSGEAFFPVLQLSSFSLMSLHGLYCVLQSGVSSISVGLWPTYVASFNLNCFLKDPQFKYSHISDWGFYQ